MKNLLPKNDALPDNIGVCYHGVSYGRKTTDELLKEKGLVSFHENHPMNIKLRKLASKNH